MPNVVSTKKVFLILLLVVLLPALFYSGYEINSLSTSEQLMGEIYRQQLDVILFSVNQYSWDVVNSWAGSVVAIANERRGASPAAAEAGLRGFLAGIPSVSTVILLDSSGTLNASARRDTGDSRGAALRGILMANAEVLGRLERYRALQYRKIEPLSLADATRDQSLALVFALVLPSGRPGYGALLVNGSVFINTIIAPRLDEAAGNEFILAVLRKGQETPVYATASVAPGVLKQQKDLWVFPDHVLGIRPAGATIEELVRGRFVRGLVLIILLDLVLLAGVWLVYRSIRREMELVRIKSDFISNVSHELRTPLALIRMFAETLEMGRIKDDAKRQEYYATIVAETERLTRLVNNILDFSRMEAGKKEYRFAEVGLNSVVEHVMQTYAFHLKSAGFEPLMDLDPHLPAVTADAEAVTEAVINLVDNAMKYSPSEKYLRIATWEKQGRVCIEVQDHGAGIEPEHHKKIFETFYRVSSGLVHETRGSGLGLALVRHIMEAHHGSVTLTSEAGRGSAFILCFPLTTTA